MGTDARRSWAYGERLCRFFYLIVEIVKKHIQYYKICNRRLTNCKP